MEFHLLSLIVLFQFLLFVNAQRPATPGWSSSSSTTPGWGASSEGDHDNNEQWSGVGQGGNFGQQQQPNWGRPTTNDQTDRGTSQAQKFGTSGFARPDGHIERYGYPERCVEERYPQFACNYSVEIRKEPGKNFLFFELSTILEDPRQGGYVAMGLSRDRKMGDDDIVECAKEGSGRVRGSHSWAKGQVQPTPLPDDSNVLVMDSVNFDINTRLLTCRFARPMTSNFQVDGRQINIDFARGKYYVLLAVGGKRPNKPDVIGYHGDSPLVSRKAYVSPDFLGYSQGQNYQNEQQQGHNSDGEHGYRPPEYYDNSGQQNKISTCTVAGVIMLFSVLKYFY